MDELGPDSAGEADNPLASVPIEVTVAVGRARPAVRDLLRLHKDSVLALDRKVDDPVELLVGDRLIAIGQLEVVDDAEGKRLAVRLTEVVAMRPPL